MPCPALEELTQRRHSFSYGKTRNLNQLWNPEPNNHAPRQTQTPLPPTTCPAQPPLARTQRVTIAAVPHPSWPFTSFAALCAFARNAQSSPWPPEPAKHLKYHTNPIRCRVLRPPERNLRKSADTNWLRIRRLNARPPWQSNIAPGHTRTQAEPVTYALARRSPRSGKGPIHVAKCCRMLQELPGMTPDRAQFRRGARVQLTGRKGFGKGP